ncbi:hypothetical protein [Enterobacter sp. Lyrl_3]|uniref:hypothetical protein n=1 Tax=Enterobacter sp. Lyrl_3 TaxID=3110922 RepID=UPI003F820F5C
MLMSKAEYAKHRGVSRQTVYAWIERGEVVMSGNKIDVSATEQRHHTPEQTEVVAAENRWAHRTIEMTWPEFWDAVKAQDGKAPAPANDEEVRQRVLAAVDEINWYVEFLDDGGVWMDTGDSEHFFTQYSFTQNAQLAIEMIRRDVCYTTSRILAGEIGDEKDDWSPAGIKALAKWAK